MLTLQIELIKVANSAKIEIRIEIITAREIHHSEKIFEIEKGYKYIRLPLPCYIIS